MDLTPDPLQTQLRRAVRAGLAGVTAAPGVTGSPVPEDPASSAEQVLKDLQAQLYELPAAHEGLELGLTAGVIVSEELGRAACGNPYRAAALAADAALATGRADLLASLLEGTTVALAGLESLPPGTAITASPAGAGWELTGTVAADAAGRDLLAVTCRVAGTAALALVPAKAPGCEASGGWPHAVRLAGVAVGADQLLGPIAEPAGGPLARARVRQAGYLVGLATGMLEAAVGYVGGRWQFGTRLRDLPPVAFPLAQQMIALRAARMACYRAAWLIDSGRPAQAPVEALALSAEMVREVARVSMQVCGVRAMTPELSLHRYYRLVPTESGSHGEPGALWRLAGAARIAGRLPGGHPGLPMQAA